MGKPYRPMPPYEFVRADIKIREDGVMVRQPHGNIIGNTRANYTAVVTCGGTLYTKARLAWFWHYGTEPGNNVYFIDGNPENCAIDNLATKGDGPAPTNPRVVNPRAAHIANTKGKSAKKMPLVPYAGKALD